MFAGCKLLTSLNLTNFDTTNVTDLGYMFDGCKALTSLDLSGFQTYNASNLMYFLNGCSALTAVDISNLDTSSTTGDTMNQMRLIYGCSNLQYVIIGSSMFRMPLIRSDAISLPSTCKILVPSALISTYQNATNWSVHTSKFDAIENYDIVRSNGQVTVTPKNA